MNVLSVDACGREYVVHLNHQVIVRVIVRTPRLMNPGKIDRQVTMVEFR
ncbi:hypothetical protein [Candidatus Berkiella aquae]|uniref:Uncharacterized protein n=1 Tax=Candidatus Berkiella aquae TaxID=295108 RepID=A0AAE3HYG6_9GAMM|nr:hypothetical protein [Candidatus Berkiella aquae]MCS5712887.1 hypothetical protein [Candidatus Berkiella aquae]